MLKLTLWPHIFQRPAHFTPIRSDAFRGIGVVTAQPDAGDESIHPVTGVCFGDGSVRQHVSEHVTNVWFKSYTSTLREVGLLAITSGYYVIRAVLVTPGFSNATSSVKSVDFWQVDKNGVDKSPFASTGTLASTSAGLRYVPVNVALDVGYGVEISVYGAAIAGGDYVNVYIYYDVVGAPNTDPFGPVV